jgi:hypothetical protein
MRTVSIAYIILSLLLNFIYNSLTTLLLAFVSFPLVLLLIRKKKKPRKE